MPRTRSTILALALVLAGGVAWAQPLFELEDDGRTFLYRARPGDHPGRIAQMFGIPSEDVPALLRDNGIRDDTQISSGFVYRVPNAAARALADEVDALRAERGRLADAAADAERRAAAAAREARIDRETAARVSERAARGARLERLWPFLQAALLVLVLAAGGALLVARTAVARQRQAERYAKTLAAELEERRKTGLAERQEAARRILDLEQRVRTLESRAAPARTATTRAT
jgi:hypothetical protein